MGIIFFNFIFIFSNLINVFFFVEKNIIERGLFVGVKSLKIRFIN